MTDGTAYFFKYATLCQGCGQKQRNGPLFTRVANDFHDPETWFCEECGEPLFPDHYYAQIAKDDGAGWCICPNGHAYKYDGNSDKAGCPVCGAEFEFDMDE